MTRIPPDKVFALYRCLKQSKDIQDTLANINTGLGHPRISRDMDRAVDSANLTTNLIHEILDFNKRETLRKIQQNSNNNNNGSENNEFEKKEK